MTTTPPQDRTDLPGALAAADQHRPLFGYAVLMSVFGAGMTGGRIAARRTGRSLPERFGAQDLAKAGIATQKLSRLITKDKITGVVRVPFTRFQETRVQGTRRGSACALKLDHERRVVAQARPSPLVGVGRREDLEAVDEHVVQPPAAPVVLECP
jgi:hypothetical protein